ncbi:MAG: nucleotidyltransferase family protein [Roseobacter sp.]
MVYHRAMKTPQPITDLPIILLAAGQSSRMRGRDKLLEKIDGVTLLRLQVRRARAATAGLVLVALPSAPHPRYSAIDGYDVTPVSVPDAASGMTASLRRALQALPTKTPAVMILLADLPELETEDLAAVFEAVDLDTDTVVWRGVTSGGAFGHPLVVRSKLFCPLMQLTGDTGGADVIGQHRNKTVAVPLPGNRALRDLDTPEEWAAWRAARNTSGEN